MPIDTVFCINNNQSIFTFTSFIYNIIAISFGAVCGALATSKLATNTIKKQEFIKAAAEFRSKFVDFLYELKFKLSEKESDITMSEDINWSKTTMDKIGSIHEKACIRFEPFVNKSKRSDFIAIYSIYLYPDKGDKYKSYERLEYYSDGKPSEEVKIRKLIYERLNELLKFAEVK